MKKGETWGESEACRNKSDKGNEKAQWLKTNLQKGYCL